MAAKDIKKALKDMGYNVLPINNTETGWSLQVDDDAHVSRYVIRDVDINHVATVDIESDDALGIIFNGQLYETAKSLCDAIKAYNESLPLSIRYYDPLMTKRNATICALEDYLVKIGFKESYSENMVRSFRLDSVYGFPLIALKVSICNDMMSRDREDGMIVDARTSFGNSCDKLIFGEFTDALDGIKVINSLIEAAMLSDMSKQLQMLEKLSPERRYESMESFDYATAERKKMKSFVKKELESQLKQISK